MPEINEIQLYFTKDLEKLLGCDRHKIYQYRKAGLLKGRIVGKSFASSGEEIREFYRITQGMDLSNPARIRLAGQLIRKKCGRSSTPYRNQQVI